jgi:hypothetical protein
VYKQTSTLWYDLPQVPLFRTAPSRNNHTRRDLRADVSPACPACHPTSVEHSMMDELQIQQHPRALTSARNPRTKTLDRKPSRSGRTSSLSVLLSHPTQAERSLVRKHHGDASVSSSTCTITPTPAPSSSASNMPLRCVHLQQNHISLYRSSSRPTGLLIA